MSNTIDQRVVEMQFDNKNFEKNVSTSMSTLDKFKEKLQFKGATKGLDEVNASAKKVDVSPMGRAVESVSAKFSAMQVVAVTALANITNSAINAGKRIVSALTIDPVRTGFQEYETQINATQTILANVGHKGKTLDDVNNALEELNKYADQTIYNFTEMTKNIGLFTNAGVGLEESVTAIKGFSNAAAMAGTDATRTAGAMYQLSQAMSSGAVRLQDWRSLEQANITGERFQETIKVTARAHGIAIDDMIEKEGNFRETLKSGWLTADLMSEALEHYTLSTEAMSEADQKAAREKLKLKGYTDEQIDSLFALGTEATNAATKVKTFTQLWGVLKESAQSGWSKTWKIIIGDFEQAKNLFTPLSDALTGVINKMSEWRNAILESALGRGIGKLSDSLNTILKPVKTVTDGIDKVTGALENLDTIAGSVIGGKYGNSDTGRFEKLTEEGYNYCVVQNRVNELLGDSFRYTQEQIDAQDKLIKSKQKTTEGSKEEAKATTTLNEQEKDRLKGLLKMTEAELRAKNYNEDQIEALKELGATAKRLGIPIDEFVDKMDEINGRWLLLNSFKNIGKALVDVFNVLKKAWQEIFPPKTIEERGEGLFNLIARFHKFTASLRLVDAETGELTKTGDNLVRTFKGVFAIFDVIRTLIGGAFRLVFKVVQGVLKHFNLNITDVTAAIGDLLVKFRDWFKGLIDIDGIVSWLVPKIKKAATATKEWFDKFKNSDFLNTVWSIIKKIGESVKDFFTAFKESKGFNDFINAMKSIGSRLGTWFAGLKDSKNIGRDIILGLVNGITQGIPEILSALGTLVTTLITEVKERLGIESPSKVFMAIGAFIVLGLINGISGEAGGLLGSIKNIFQPVFDFLGNINWGSIASLGSLAVLLLVIKQVFDVFRKLNTIVDIVDNCAESLLNIGQSVKKLARAKSFQMIAVAIAILVASLIALTFVDGKKLWNAVGVVVTLVVIVGALIIAMSKLGPSDVGEMAKYTLAILEVAGAILIVAIAMKILSKIDRDSMEQAGLALVAIILSFMMVGKMSDKLNKGGDFGSTLLKMAAGILILAIVAKMLAKMTWKDMGKAAAGLGGLTAVILALVWMTKFAGKDIDKVGKTILQIALAIGILTLVAKMIAKMTWDDMKKAVVGLGGLTALVLGLIWMTKFAGKDIDKVGKTIFKIGAAIALLGITAKIIAGMTWEEMAKGAAGIAYLGGIVVGLIAATRLAGSNNIKKIGKTILQIALAIGILGLVCALLGLLKEEYLKRGLVAITALGTIVSGLIAATKLAGKSAKNNIIAITIAIAVIAAAVAALSFIKPEKLKPAVEAIAVMMAMFALVLKAGSNVESAWGSIISMAAIVAVLAGAIWILSKIPGDKAVDTAIAMGILMSVMVGVLYILSKISTTFGEALVGIGLLTLMIAPMFAFVWVLSVASNIENAEANARVLITLMTAMTVLLLVLTLVGALVYAGFIGVASLLAMAVPMLAFVGILALMNKIQNAQENADLLIGLMTKLTKILVVLALIGPMATIGVLALTGLVTLMGVVAILAAAIGALTKDGSTLIKGIDMMVIIAEGMGRMIGKFITALASEVMTILPALGTALSEFMTNAQVFIEGCKNVNAKVLVGIAILTAAIMALTVADLLAAISSFLQGGSSFGQLGQDLSDFMTKAQGFVKGASAIKPEMLDGVKAIAQAILILTAANLLDSIAGFFTGDSSLTKFANELPFLGLGLAMFANSLSDMDEAGVMKVNLAAQAIKTLAQAAAEIPNSGGWVAKICGENDLGVFADQFPKLGTGLADMYEKLKDFDENKLGIVRLAAECIKILAEAAGEIPNSGGWLGKIIGDNDLGPFADQFPKLGTGITELLENLPEGFCDEQVDMVERAANCVKALATAAKEIPNEGGWAAKIIGDNDLESFSKKFPYVGSGIRDLLANLPKDFNDTQVQTVESAANAVTAIALAAKEIPNEGGWVSKIIGDNDMESFANKFPALGAGLRGFVDEIGMFNEQQRLCVSLAITALNTIINLADVKKLSKRIDDIEDFGDALPDLGKNISKFVEKMPSAEDVTAAINSLTSIMSATESIGEPSKDLGKSFVSFMISGMNSKAAELTAKGVEIGNRVVQGIQQFANGEGTPVLTQGRLIADKVIAGITERIASGSLSNAGKSLGKEVVNGVKGATTVAATGKYSPAEAAGREFANGLIRGMNAKKTEVYNAGYALGEQAEKGYDDATDTNSPSKVMIQKGKWYGEGLIIGMSKMGSDVYGAGHSLGETATKSISNTISSIADAFNSDVDTQPTIRPVLDLSDVRTGASALGSMLDMNSTVGVRANVRAVSSMMNGRNQNGVNDDVVSAINKLRKDLGNTAGATYQINGVTYDDGSNIREAVETIVRAARIERRV